MNNTRKKKESRLKETKLRKGKIVKLNNTSYQLIEPISALVTYIPGCEDEEDFDCNGNEVDANCDVFCYQEWLVMDLELFIEMRITFHAFLAKWHTVLGKKDLYNKVALSDEFMEVWAAKVVED